MGLAAQRRRHMAPWTAPGDRAPPHVCSPSYSPSCQKKTLGCKALGSTLETATSTSRKVVFLISAISSSENSLHGGKAIAGMGRGFPSSKDSREERDWSG